MRQAYPAYQTAGREFVELPGGISELRLDGQSLNPGSTEVRRFPCGVGPQITVAGQLRDTSLRASTRDLIRGRSVPLKVCGSADILLTQQATSLLALPTPPDAVFVANDHMAIAAMDVLRLELGLRIPEDVGVIGFDDVPQAAWGAYQLTTVRQHVEPMVDAAVTLLRERMHGQAPARDIVVPCVLVERKTVRPTP